jgi:hypothetical protein
MNLDPSRPRRVASHRDYNDDVERGEFNSTPRSIPPTG